MDFIGYQCPVCDKNFHADDDIVVCPECGTPHHRECYDSLGECKNAERHAQGYDFSKENEPQGSDTLTCPKCGEACDKSAFFCNKCGSPLTISTEQEAVQNPNDPPSYGAGFPMGMSGDMFDPMGGVEQGFDMGQDVTAGEITKYVKQNTPYFVRVFYNIKSFSRSKFNFAAAIFTGGYLLYRKMYKLGAIITVLQVAMLLFVTYIYNSASFSAIFAHINTLYSSAGDYTNAAMSLMEYMATLTPFQNFVLFLPSVYSLIQVITMITVGACANRLYFSHCKKQIVAIKAQSTDITDAETKLQVKGGVNTALGLSLLITYLLINYLPPIIFTLF